MKCSIKIVPFIVLALAFSARAAEETTQTYLAKYGDKLSAAWASYPQEKDLLIRKQKITDLTTAFAIDIKTLDAPKDITLGKIISNFLSNLEKARGLFRSEKMNSEKSSYISACGLIFKRELPFASDAETERAASKCFDMLNNWTDDARVHLRVIPDDAINSVFNNLNEAFQTMIKSATKDPGDPSTVYEQEIKDIQHRYPVTTPALQKINQPARTMLETAAKKVLDFNKKP